MTTRTFRFQVQAPQVGVPSWFATQDERTWKAVASTATIASVYPGQAPLNYGGTYPSLATAWTGGCVDQSRGELLFVANGGHGDYAGNEVYACAIKTENPAWYRLNDHTPGTHISPIMSVSSSTSNLPAGQGFNPNGFAGMFLDGRMRAQHGWHGAIFANGRAWYHRQASVSGVGNGTPHAWSFNRSYVNGLGDPMPTAPGQTPQRWEDNAGPWQWHGTSDDGRKGDTDVVASNFGFGTGGPSAYDRATGLIWTLNADQPKRAWSSLDTGNVSGTPGVLRRCNTINVSAPNGQFDGGWATVVYDPTGQDRWRMWVGGLFTGNLVVFNLKAADPYSSAAITHPVATSNPTALATSASGGVNVNDGGGAVYHAPSRSIIVCNPVVTGGTLYKIQVPVDGSGNYAPTTPWQVTVITPTGAEQPSGGSWGSYNKFNIIDDMGNGQSALVVCMTVTSPTYVFKLPIGELT